MSYPDLEQVTEVHRFYHKLVFLKQEVANNVSLLRDDSIFNSTEVVLDFVILKCMNYSYLSELA